MEKYLGYTNVTIKNMILDRRQSLDHAVTEMIKFPKDGNLYQRVQSQAQELAELVKEWEFRNDEIITT